MECAMEIMSALNIVENGSWNWNWTKEKMLNVKNVNMKENKKKHKFS